jgi:hypothetical protein
LTRLSKQKTSSRTDEKRTPLKDVNGYLTTSSSQVHGSALQFANAHDQEIKPSIETAKMSEIEYSQTTNPTSYEQSFQSSLMTSVAEHYYYYPVYAAAVTTGVANLGVEVSDHLQYSLLDRYGQHSSWSVTREAGSVPPVHNVLVIGYDTTSEFDASPYQQAATYKHGDGKLEDLAGIGAQFDY